MDWASIINGILVGGSTVLSTYNKNYTPSRLTIDPVTGQYYATNMTGTASGTSSITSLLTSPLVMLALLIGGVYLLFRRKRR